MSKNLFQNWNHLKVDRPDVLASGRVASIDALRGFDMFWIIGGGYIFSSLDKIFHSPVTASINIQLDHVKWFGFHFYDIIMPLFLFIVGVAMPFSYRRRLSRNPSKSILWGHILRRFIILWILGMVVQGNLLNYSFEEFKLYSNTLQAIASGYLIASIIILYMGMQWQVIATVLLMIAYWAIMTLISVPGIGAGMITPDGNFAIYLDKLLLGRFQDGTTYSWIVSSLNFGATTMLGVFTGYLLQSNLKSTRKFLFLLISGIGLILLGKIWDLVHPIVKHIWTSSFVLYSGGICLLLMAFFYLVFDHWKVKTGSAFFIIIGINAIFIYVSTHIFDFGIIADVMLKGLEKYVGEWYDFIRAIGSFSIVYFILWFMYKRKIFIKI